MWVEICIFVYAYIILYICQYIYIFSKQTFFLKENTPDNNKTHLFPLSHFRSIAFHQSCFYGLVQRSPHPKNLMPEKHQIW